MSLFFITGIAGTGKSSVTRELLKRGYEAHDADDYCEWTNKQSGELDDGKSGIPYGTPEFYNTFSWTLLPEKIAPMREKAKNNDVFICGSPSNARELVATVDKAYCLAVDDETLKHRLATRTDNDYGKADHELNDVLGWNKTFASDLRALGATVIDATKPVTEVVDEILANSKGA